jgi:hypothetical protein
LQGNLEKRRKFTKKNKEVFVHSLPISKGHLALPLLASPWEIKGGEQKTLLCPFAVYYLRYAVRSFFTMSRIYLTDGKRAGQKVQRKIAVAVQNVKPPLLFVPLF